MSGGSAPGLRQPGFLDASDACFPTLLAIALLLTAGVGAAVVYDAESNWQEGAILVGLYVVIASSFWRGA